MQPPKPCPLGVTGLPIWPFTIPFIYSTCAASPLELRSRLETQTSTSDPVFYIIVIIIVFIVVKRHIYLKSVYFLL